MTIESETTSNSKSTTLHSRRRIVSDTIIPQELEAKIRMSGSGIRKRKVVLPATFKITENYIKNQIDGLIPKQATLRKRRTRHIKVQSEPEVEQEIIRPVVETVQAILSEPEPIPVSFPHPSTEISLIVYKEPVSIPILRPVESYITQTEIPEIRTSTELNIEILPDSKVSEKKKGISLRKIGIFIKNIFTKFAKKDPRRQSLA